MSIFRISPPIGPQHYTTYRILAPFDTHWRKATCEEVNCPAFMNGWRTTIDERGDRGAAQAYYIRRNSGRSFTEERTPDGLTAFTFTAGQPCFSRDTHRIKLDRPEEYFRLGGDYRGNPGRIAPYRHTRPDLWVEDMSENQERLRRIRNG